MPTAGVKHRAHERLFAAQGARKRGVVGEVVLAACTYVVLHRLPSWVTDAQAGAEPITALGRHAEVLPSCPHRSCPHAQRSCVPGGGWRCAWEGGVRL
jgi:hypothetical protein